MRFRRFARLLGSFTLVLLAASMRAAPAEPLAPAAARAGAAPSPASWPFVANGLRPDPALTFGTLENGLRYAVQSNATPPGRVALRLLVLAGSLHETEAQRGLAHFVEHMAFNGTRNFPGESLAASLQKEGIAFGPDVTAFTHLTHTIYHVDLPDASPAKLGLGFRVLRDFADGLTFERRQVNRERGVVLSEARARDTAGQRMGEARQHFLYPLNLLGHRSPIGEHTIIERASPGQLRTFYDTWYRPENLVVFAIGDAPVDTLVAQIQAQFGSLKRRPTPPPPAPDVGTITNPATLTAMLHSDGEAIAFSAELVSTRPAPGRDDREVRAAWLRAHIASYALQARLQELRQRQPDVFGGSLAQIDQPTPWAIEASLRLECRPRDWRLAVLNIEQELRRALTLGFNDAELAVARAALIGSYDYQERARRTFSSDALIARIVERTVFGFVSTPADDELAFVREVAPTIDSAACVALLRSLWGGGAPRLFAYGNWVMPDAAEQLTTAYLDSSRLAVARPASVAVEPFAYTDFGPPGEIVSRDHIGDLDIHRITFANGVRLNLKRTPFDAATVILSARLGRGQATEPADQPGLGAIATSAFLRTGVAKHDSEALRRVLAGRPVSLGFAAAEECFQFYGSADTPNALLLLQLFTAYLRDPAWRATEFTEARSQLLSQRSQLLLEPAGVISTEGNRLLASGDARYGLAAPDTLEARTLAGLRAWLEPALRSAPLELALVGDFDLEALIAAAAATVGTLPERDLAPDPAAERPVTFAQSPLHQRFNVPTQTDRAVVQFAWPVSNDADVHRQRRLDVLAEILENRLLDTIREEMGATYAPGCDAWHSDLVPAEGFLYASVTVKTADVDRVTRRMREIADRLARDGVSPQEFERARQPQLQGVQAQLNANAYWAHRIVPVAQSQPDRLGWPRTRESDLRAMTAADLSQLARNLLPAKRAHVFTALPAR